MPETRFEQHFNLAREIAVEKRAGGLVAIVDGREYQVPIATNFEFRMAEPVPVSHAYVGTETIEDTSLRVSLSFSDPCYVRMSAPDARCYIYVQKL